MILRADLGAGGRRRRFRGDIHRCGQAHAYRGFQWYAVGFTVHELGAIAIASVLDDAGIAPEIVEETIMGQVLAAGAGMNPARQAARGAGLADGSTAFVVNQVCGSGLRTVALGYQQIVGGEAMVIMAAGQESMSQAPHVASMRSGKKLGDIALIDTVIRDGLSDAFYGYPMGVTAENIIRRDGLSREDQDAFALRRQQREGHPTRLPESGAFGYWIVR